MSTTIISEPMMVSTQLQDPTQTTSIQPELEIQFIKCECCGLTEECTPAYIEKIRKRYMGKWICGLCSEAVKDEVARFQRLITTEEALNRHVNVCRKFQSSCPPAGGDPAVHLISAMRSILRRSLDSRSAPASPTREVGTHLKLTRSESCFPGL
ncbi:hypothetical protein RND81_05G243400 [Saponaria officinalis]|uniref:DUF1677 family protein n=1 Tax=Saponaria officinalis TaxID=3572 RepID=A0AAW1L0V5_SAPOF